MRWAIIGCALLAAACSPAMEDTPLSGLDLGNPRTLAALQARLPLDDRAPLATYALLHWPRSKFFCGEAIGGSRRPAETVGEAIAQTRAYEADLEKRRADETLTRANPSLARRKALVDRIDLLVMQRDIARDRGITDEISAIDKQLALLREQFALEAK